MSRSLSWIDSGRLVAALRRAGATVPGAGERSAPTLSGAAFGGHTDAETAKRPLRGAGLQPALRVDRTGAEPFCPAEGNLQERLQELLDWIRQRTQCRRVFVLDEEGLVVMEHGADPDLIAVSSSFASYQDRIRSCLGSVAQGSIAIDLEGGDVLRLLEASTELGRFVLGVVVATPMSTTTAHLIRTALARAMEDEGLTAQTAPGPGLESEPKAPEGA